VRAPAKYPALAPVVMALCAACWSPPDRVGALRPLTLRVVEAGSKRPAQGVPVTYLVQSRVNRDRFLGLIPTLEPIMGARVAIALHGTTDHQGEVTFRVQGLPQPGNESWSMEFVFVNVAVDRSKVGTARLASVPRPGQALVTTPAAGPSDAEVAWQILPLREERQRAFWNPVAGLRGVVVINTLDGPSQAQSDWSEKADCFRVRWNAFDQARAAERVEVELEGAERR